MPQLSLIIPVMNESPNIGALSDRISMALAGLDHELIWVDDGSTDGSSEMIKKYADENTRLIILTRNFGQSAALQAGFHEAKGKYIASLDGDGQNDPLDLVEMFNLIKKNDLDMVAGTRVNRKDHFIRTFPSRVANFLIRKLTRTDLKDLGCSTRIIKKQIALSLPLKKGMHRYINVLVEKQGARIMQIPVNHSARTGGKSKYGLSRIFPVIRDLGSVLKQGSVPGKPYNFRHYEVAAKWTRNQATRLHN